MMENVIIIGASGHARVIADTIRCSGNHVLGFLDDREPNYFSDMKILGKVRDAEKFADRTISFIIGVGSNDTRERITEKYGSLKFYTAIHPSAVIASDVVIGSGSAVMANVVINTGSKIGRHCIINTAATVDHDNIIDDYVHLSPGVHLSGTVSVGKGTWIGTGAAVGNNINICGGCVVGAGAVVVKDLPTKCTAVGSPAKPINFFK